MKTTRMQDLLAGVFVCALAFATTALAQDESGAATPQAHESPEVEHHHPNELALFLGGTHKGDETHLTIGAEYERRLGERWGVAFVAEHVSEVDAWVFVAPFTFRPVDRLGLKLYAGPGLESAAEHEGRESFFVLRGGLGWAVELGERASLTPQIELDLVREGGEWQSDLVFGVAVGFGF